MNDRQLLEFAAKAAEIEVYWCELDNCHWLIDDSDSFVPLDNDGDALRLAVKLHLKIDVMPWGTIATKWDESMPIDNAIRHNDDPYAATRKAIVRAAAEIGKEQP